MKTLRKLRALAPRRVYRDVAAGAGAGADSDLEPPPEAVFDRSTGPFGSRRAVATPGGYDEET
jgi:hypothetical protein